MTDGERWSLADMPDQTGRRILVTGATGGLGEQVALEFARRGASVVLAGRNAEKLASIVSTLRGEIPNADLNTEVVDLADLESTRAAGARVAAGPPIDILVNNAGIMAPPYKRTGDGIETQMATNHFGPFLFTGSVLPALSASGAGRVVTVSSNAHRMARQAPLEDPRDPAIRHHRWAYYARSKLANLLFTMELERRTESADLPIRALAAHPGYAATHLIATGQTGRSSGGIASILNAVGKATAQSAAVGALPLLMAASADLPGGSYVGPSGPGEWRGRPAVVTARRLAYDEQAARELWDLSEQVTGIHYP